MPGYGNSDANADSITWQTPEMCGQQSQDIVVSMIAFRGGYPGPGGTSGADLIPRTMVTVYDFEHYEALKASVALKAAQENGLAAHEAIAGLKGSFEAQADAVTAMADVVGGMDSDQRAALDSALGAVYDGKPLSDEHAAALKGLAALLKAH